MSAFEVNLTAAGYAAFVNPDNTGTNAVKVETIGVTAQAFAASSATVMLPNEIKRISTIAGTAIANNVIHVTMIDNTADEYDLRGFAGYDENGTLLFVYGDPNPANLIFQKSTLSYAGMSADIAFVQAIEADVEFGDVSFINPPASESIPGVSRRATLQQHIDGAATDVTATPAGIKALLDSRFGNGAPAAFVKGLLNLATAVLFRAAIGVKDVATRDMGHGGGIDADTLDGSHASAFMLATSRGAIGGVAPLDSSGKVPAANLPSIALVDVYAVGSQSAQLALSAQRGDVAVRSDINRSYIHNGGTAGTMADWTELRTPTDAVLSVAGRTGAVTLAIVDIDGLAGALAGKAANGHTHAVADVTGLQGALDARAQLAGATFTGNVAAPKFTRNSSLRYKRDITDIDHDAALELVMTVAFKAYTMKADGSRSAGAIAEYLAGGPLDWIVTRTDNGDPEGIDYEPLFVLSCAALQGLAARVSALESRA